MLHCVPAFSNLLDSDLFMPSLHPCYICRKIFNIVSVNCTISGTRNDEITAHDCIYLGTQQAVVGAQVATLFLVLPMHMPREIEGSHCCFL